MDNKNNPFVKFAYFYIANIKGLKDDAIETLEDIFNELLPSLIKIFFNILAVISRIVYCFLPIKQIRGIFTTCYFVVNENGVTTHSGYCLKKDMEKLKEELAEKEAANA